MPLWEQRCIFRYRGERIMSRLAPRQKETFAAFAVLAAATAILVSAPQSARAGIIVTTGAAKLDIETVEVSGALIGTGSTSVYARAGDNVAKDNQLTNAPDSVPIEFKDKNGKVTESYAGKGVKNAPKYTDKKGNTETSTAEVTKTVNPNTTKTTAKGYFSAFDPKKVGNKTVYESLNVAKGKVDDKANVGGLAAALAKDPIVYHFDTSGTLTFSLTLGDASASLADGGTFEFASDDPGGRNHLDFEASLSGVSYNGQTFDGDIFRLVIDGAGLIRSSADLKIDFVPSPLLGLSQDTIKAVDDYIAGKLQPQDDGSVGLAPGTEFDLFGAGSPLGPLTFSYGPGDVTYADSLAVGAQLPATPEPSSLALVGVGGLVLGVRGLRQVVKQGR
jgi:hypothetical protein